MALVQGRAVTMSDLKPALLEAQGGQALAEFVLDQMLERRLAESGQKLTPELLDAEQMQFLSTLAPDPNQAKKLLEEVRKRRGLGPQRFAAFMRRNAALRLLAQPRVQVTDAMIRDAFELRYGEQYEARLITAATLPQAAELARRAREGESFMDLAIAHSTDSSKSQGGLLPPIRLADPTFPLVMRQALPRLALGQVSDPLMLEQGFAVLRLERKIERQKVQLDDVKQELQRQVRLEQERQAMQSLARELLSAAEVVVLDPALNASWNQQKQTLRP